MISIMIHRNVLCILASSILAMTVQSASAKAPSIELTPISSVAAITPGISAAEIVAHDPSTQRIFVVNALAAKIDVFDISDPALPQAIVQLDITPYGAVANSVAVHDGIIAVAVEANPKTDPGKVVFFNNALEFLTSVEVGALPDMLTFSQNGRFVLVANEGEPSLDYTVDPEGSVSVIQITRGSNGGFSATTRTADFKAFNNATLDPSIRIFGPDKSKPPGAVASVAQDLEPEYIAVSQDSKTAWVTCQENNAIATVDIASAKVTKLTGLGFKDHNAGDPTTIHAFNPASLPSIGTTLGGQQMKLGGFSGLQFEGVDPTTGRYKFVTNTDRGPNAEPTGILRPFLLPNFTPEIVRFELDRNTGVLSLTQRIPLQRAPGQSLTGRPNTAISGDANAAYNDEVPVDLLGNVLPLDPLGADVEGLAVDPADGSFWMVDEYRPAIYHFDSQGVLLKRYIPIGTATAAGQPAGSLGDEVLPAVLAQRRQNRGFEGIALDGGKIYAFVQSPLRNPTSLSNATLNGMLNIRVVEFDPATLATRQFIYVLDNPNLGAEPNTRPDKIGDATALGNGEFLVIERDDDAVPGDVPTVIEKKVFRFSLAGATDVSSFTGTVGSTGKTVDQLTVTEMVLNNIRPIDKTMYVDLNAAGYNGVQKVEGLAVVDEQTIAVINDNDFGVASITINPDGTFTLNPGYTPETEQLGLITVGRSNRLDTSDRDGIPVINPNNPAATLTTGKINIRQWPVKGMYLPDGIASYKVGSKSYLVMAHEGDAREYVFTDGMGNTVVAFDEQARVGTLNLDPIAFPNGTFLKNNANLGRLRVTNTLGWKPATPPTTGRVYEELYSFGARSFSIRDTDGNLIFDSGDDFEWLTAAAYPAFFNASHENNTFDDRSDDKGPEPEGLTLGKVFGRTYAFIGFERIGGVAIYDISEPEAPEFVQYLNNRDFTKPVNSPEAGDLGPEGLLFIKAEDSPSGEPLLVIANEISGTTTVYRIAESASD